MIRAKNGMVFLMVVAFFLMILAGTGGVVNAASKYPKKNIKWIVMWRAGGGADTATRIFIKQFEKFIGKKAIVNNITGGAATVGYLAAKTAKPDGYTLVTIQGDLPKFEIMKLAPIAIDDFDILPSFAYQSPVIAVRADAPWKTVEDFVADAQKRPEKIAVGITDIGGIYHQPLVLWEEMAGFRIKPVFHKSSPAQTASLLGGHVDANITWVRPNISYVKEGKIRFLAYMSIRRHPDYPDVPTLREKGWDVHYEHPYGVGGPKGLPEEVKKIISEATMKVWDVPEFEKDLAKVGLSVFRLDGPAYTRHIKNMQKNSARAIKIINERKK
ncbi:MAG: tripartite tricarboxylate transporter substrate binding protein [Deltaproteobacteria bacterium]|nr:tripartite tricarboxylate transporter substrate binding protein [Deltaproteobacteria bacterium]MBW1961118.1 tripartite tricarboxylate transporter substrate binding protein [Deltaproteobacteria bacterium]MBW1993602.1 tripartite tricarboxylate transporter substrate binding protein [Deltaproteobacteria bacterium]MBW2152658.1 tripartite tricarboxylate transporter substrate binding protein [Deltaproteobacteria bacterium]